MKEFYEEEEHFYLVFDRLKGGMYSSTFIVYCAAAMFAQRNMLNMPKLVSGSLFEQIQKHGHFTEMEASEIIKNLAEALAFLHRKG